MNNSHKLIVLAEDDEDDSQFFEDALNSVSDSPQLLRAKDGVELTDLLHDLPSLPEVIFMDLNMPRKNGSQCLAEIRQEKSLQNVPVVIMSTSGSSDIIESAYRSGANLYVQKPNDFSKWKQALKNVLDIDWNIQTPYAVREKFLLSEY